MLLAKNIDALLKIRHDQHSIIVKVPAASGAEKAGLSDDNIYTPKSTHVIPDLQTEDCKKKEDYVKMTCRSISDNVLGCVTYASPLLKESTELDSWDSSDDGDTDFWMPGAEDGSGGMSIFPLSQSVADVGSSSPAQYTSVATCQTQSTEMLLDLPAYRTVISPSLDSSLSTASSDLDNKLVTLISPFVKDENDTPINNVSVFGDCMISDGNRTPLCQSESTLKSEKEADRRLPSPLLSSTIRELRVKTASVVSLSSGVISEFCDDTVKPLCNSISSALLVIPNLDEEKRLPDGRIETMKTKWMPVLKADPFPLHEPLCLSFEEVS